MAMLIHPHLAKEALVVGATIVPVYLMTEAFFEKAPTAMKLFITGAGYHLLSEYLGVNEWYLDNGYAQRKRYGDIISEHEAFRSSGFDMYRWKNHQYF